MQLYITARKYKRTQVQFLDTYPRLFEIYPSDWAKRCMNALSVLVKEEGNSISVDESVFQEHHCAVGSTILQSMER